MIEEEFLMQRQHASHGVDVRVTLIVPLDVRKLSSCCIRVRLLHRLASWLPALQPIWKDPPTLTTSSASFFGEW